MQDLSKQNLEGKYVIMNAKAFAKALSAIERIFHCESGFGLDPTNSGTKIYGHFLAELPSQAYGFTEPNEECYVRRYDVERLATEAEVQQALTVSSARKALGNKNQCIVAWVSRHPVLPAQIKALAEKLGEIRVVQITNTYQNFRGVIVAVKALKASHAVVVLPLSMIALILDSKEAQGITWLRAEMCSAHEGRCTDNYKEVSSDRHNSVVQVQHQCSMFNPETDVLMPGETARHVRFLEFQVLKSIDLITEPFTGGD